MDVLPLPLRPSVEQYKKRAKNLVTAARSNSATAVHQWAREWLQAIAKSQGAATEFVQGSMDRAVAEIVKRVRLESCTLANAQFLIARAHGFEKWAEFIRHIANATGEAKEFEQAADAAVTGDIETLRQLLALRPVLIHVRSSRKHHATLLHYVSANGVEDFRQKTPANAVAIAKLILDAGAMVDATAETYGGGLAQTTMNLLVSSAHPQVAGLQIQLTETLLDYGANINGLEDNSSPLMTALQFGYGDTAVALANRDARVDNVVAAAALGLVDLVNRCAIDKNTLAPEPSTIAPEWVSIPTTSKERIEFALAWACKFNRAQVAHLLLEKGVSASAKDSDNMTALHWAAANGMLDTIDALLQLGAPLEVANAWGGSVLSSTVFFARHMPVKGADYKAVLSTLIDGGAEISGVMALAEVFGGMNRLPSRVREVMAPYEGQTYVIVARRIQ